MTNADLEGCHHRLGQLERNVRVNSMERSDRTANVIAGLASFFYPGLGQLVQGRWLAALLFFVAGTVLWWVLLGWIVHILAALDCARYRG